MMENFNVTVYVNGVKNETIEFASSKIQELRIYGGLNEIQDTRSRYWNIDSFDVTSDGVVLFLNK